MIAILMISIIFLNLFDPDYVSGLACLDVKAAGSGSKFSLEALKTLSDDSLISCLLFLGKDPLGLEEGKYLWTTLIQIYQDDISNIPVNQLQQLGWIIKSIPPRDIKNLTLADIDTIAAFGQYHNLTHLQLQALAERVQEDWSAKDPSDYTFYDLMALNHILCGFNSTYINMIHPDSYKEAANVLATLQDCSRETLEALASLAVSYSAFDDPSTWHSSQTKSVGCVLNGMPGDVIATIPPEGIESLTPEIIPCLFKETLKSMTPWQLSHLTPSAAAAITPLQKSFLGFNQQKSIKQALSGDFGNKNLGHKTLLLKFCLIIPTVQPILSLFYPLENNDRSPRITVFSYVGTSYIYIKHSLGAPQLTTVTLISQLIGRKSSSFSLERNSAQNPNLNSGQ